MARRQLANPAARGPGRQGARALSRPHMPGTNATMRQYKSKPASTNYNPPVQTKMRKGDRLVQNLNAKMRPPRAGIAYGGTCIRACYAMSGTELSYGATRTCIRRYRSSQLTSSHTRPTTRVPHSRYRPTHRLFLLYHWCRLCSYGPFFCTDGGYAATRQYFRRPTDFEHPRLVFAGELAYLQRAVRY
eukprot:3343108-Rhodomonas_salina.2